MKSSKNYSSKLTKFMVGFKKFLGSQSSLNPEEYFEQKKFANENEISRFQFLKFVQAVPTPLNFNSTDILEIYNQLCDGCEEVQPKYFIKVFQEINAKSTTLPTVNQQQEEQKKRKQEENERKNKIIEHGLKKLQKYLLENDWLDLFQECDVDFSEKLSPHELNKLFMLTEIKEFQDKSIRHLVIKQIYSYFPDKEISKEQFVKFFKLPRDKLDKAKKIDFFVPPEKTIPFFYPQKTLSESKGHNKTEVHVTFKAQQSIKPPQNRNKTINDHKQDFKKKNDEKIKLTTSTIHITPPIIQTQENTKDIIEINKLFPQASVYYRNGEPEMEEFKYFEELETLIRQGKEFKDQTNPHTPKGELFKVSDFFNGSRYRLFEMAQSVIMREKSRVGIARDIEPKDIMQGQLGDCYFLSAIASLISIYPDVISEKFLFNENPANYFVVKIFLDGEWRYIKTDDMFPSWDGKEALFAQPHGRQIWVMLLQKCWAKCFESYQFIESGDAQEAFRALSGAPTEYLTLKSDGITKEVIEKKLINAFKQKYVVTASGSIYLDSLSQKKQQEIGLVSGHAYSFLKFIQANGVTLVRLRNPWGTRIWKGDWSFESTKWTKQLRDKFNYNKCPQDGSFYMCMTDFMKYFSTFVICKVNPSYTHTSLRIKFKNHKSNYVKIKVSQSGRYTLSIYQTNSRSMNLKYKNYKYSASRIILMKSSNGWEYLNSCQKNENESISVEVDLVEGQEYLVSAKMTWRYSDEEEACLTAYGPAKVLFENVDREIAPVFKKELIESFYKKNRGQKTTYDQMGFFGAYSEQLFSLEKGIGYYFVTNPKCDKTFNLTFKVSGKGVKVIKPDKLPFTFKIQKGTKFLKGFFTSPEGMKYSTSQSYSYYK